MPNRSGLALQIMFAPALAFAAGMAAAAKPTPPASHQPAPGLWSVVTQGTVSVRGYTQRFFRSREICIHPGKETQAILPPERGRCTEREELRTGSADWRMHCAFDDTQTETNCTVKTGPHRYTTACVTEVSQPPSKTDYTAEGEWLEARCD